MKWTNDLIIKELTKIFGDKIENLIKSIKNTTLFEQIVNEININ
jgi:hypothetical protein